MLIQMQTTDYMVASKWNKSRFIVLPTQNNRNQDSEQWSIGFERFVSVLSFESNTFHVLAISFSFS